MTMITKWRLVLMALCLYACDENPSSILPDSDLHYLEDYHCWPYDVSVYSVDKLKVDSSFFNYPLNHYFRVNEKYEITHWTKYNEIDSAIWNGMDSTLKECDDNVDLYNSLTKGNPIYFAGMYRLIIISSGIQKREYQEIVFLDLTNNRIHVFKDINKVF
jgi:hypothetical protein